MFSSVKVEGDVKEVGLDKVGFDSDLEVVLLKSFNDFFLLCIRLAHFRSLPWPSHCRGTSRVLRSVIDYISCAAGIGQLTRKFQLCQRTSF